MLKQESVTDQQQLVILQIDFQGEDKHTLTLNQDRDALLLLDYDSIRKKILQQYKYVATAKDKIKMSLTNFYTNLSISIPIYNRKNYTYLVNDMLTRSINYINIKIQKTGELRRRKVRQSKVQVEFDSDGSIQSAQNEEIKTALKLNTPDCEPYKNTAAVRCLFCHSSSKDREQMRRAGLFYGPFVGKRYAHLMCLLWCSDIYLNEDGQLSGVEKAIKNTQKIECSYCHQKGSSFYCHSKKCTKSGHYRCAQDNKWFFNWSQYRSYCPKCNQSTFFNASQSQSHSRSNPHSLIHPEPLHLQTIVKTEADHL